MRRLGVHPLPEDGWEFAVVSDGAAAVTLELYAEGEFERPCHRAALEPEHAELVLNGSARVWSCVLADEIVAAARCYAYRVAGPASSAGAPARAPAGGADPAADRFDPAKPLLDPYAREIVFPPGFSREAARRRGEETAGRAPLGVLPGREGPRRREPPPPPTRDPTELVVYELHVDAFTRRDPEVPAEGRGTYGGLIEKIPYLLDLGITAVELMPVFQWDPQERNYWGYMPMGFFAAERRFAAGGGAPGGDPAGELAAAVAELHRAGIEVWLDVVYNHTAEGDEEGPTYSFRGLDDAGYYLHDPDDPRRYRDDSGTGNVFACGRPAPRRLILDSLRYWAEEIGVAGFRCDLATLLARDAGGRPDPDPPLFRDIEAFAAESGVRLVAEPWDLGVYGLGAAFPGDGWSQWNGRFRDAMRSFVRGDAGLGREPMLRLAGSPDLFPDRRAGLPVNYAACHDGFNLYDLLSYDRPRDHDGGHGAGERSANHGFEGDDGAPEEVIALRVRQAKNLLYLVLLAAGVPMLYAGDEFLDTRLGYHNPYDRDDESNWLDWSRRERFAEVHRFVRRLIAFRRARPWLARAPWGGRAAWHLPDGPSGAEPAAGADPRAFACHLSEGETATGGEELFLAVNAAGSERVFEPPAGGGWRRAVDTSLAAPRDAAEPGTEEPVAEPVLAVAPRSTAVLLRRG